MTARLLANENFPRPSIAVLRAAGHDVLAISDLAPGMKDASVLCLAAEQDRWIITFDRDYGDLVFARDLVLPPAVILLRIRSYRPDGPGRMLCDLLAGSRDLSKCFVVLEDDGVRVRPLPVR